jgi:hypothetical protein
VREIDGKSVLIAGLIGSGLGLVFYAIEQRSSSSSSSPAGWGLLGFAMEGFLIGAGVQVGLRLTAVS